ncbi:MAG: toll/interleukin-1 receptor domain-containing protein [Acidobacteriota bacterium]
MPYVPGFDYDLFISYASGDNDQGAVEQFVATLEKHISDNLVNYFSPREKIKIYFDRQRLASQTAVNWEDNLEAAATSSAILVALISPNYVSSLYCSKERIWFAKQAPGAHGCPFSVVAWLPVDADLTPKEFEKAQRHPANATQLALLSPDERIESTRSFAIKLRDALVMMRASAGAVFLGPATGRSVETRNMLRDELEKSGYRVVPEVDFQYGDEVAVRKLLKSALLAVHFPADGLGLEGLTTIEASFQAPARKTILIQPFGTELGEDEKAVLEENSGAPHSRLEGKTDDQVWDHVYREVRSARFQSHKSEFAVGIACEARDLAGARTLAALISKAGVRAQCPQFDMLTTTTARLQALRQTIVLSRALLCYWATADGKGLEKRLAQDARRKYEAKAWYLGPPFDVPEKQTIGLHSGMVLRQRAEMPDLADVEPFLRNLGWEPAP